MEDDPSAQGVLDAEQAFLNAMRESEQQDEESTPAVGDQRSDGEHLKEENEQIEDIENAAVPEDRGDGSGAEYSPTASTFGSSAVVDGTSSSNFQTTNVQENASTGAGDDQYDPSHNSGDNTTSVVVQGEPNGEFVGTNGTHLRESSTQASTPVPNTSTPTASAVPEHRVLVNPESSLPSGQAVNPTHQSQKRKRLPQDIVGQLEDRIADDPRGDVDAWLALIGEHQKKGKFDEARGAYERFLQIWPTAAEQWIAYTRMELSNNELRRVEQIFSRCLLTVFNVDLWSLYLDYVRRINNLATDTEGKARQVISQAYEFVLEHVGIDKDSGRIWQDYVAFIRTSPGNIGGSGWQDQQKMDHLRKVYQKVICLPVQGVDVLWREYDTFEMGLNKVTGRKFLQERSPAFMTARASLHELNGFTSELDRHRLARLPPLPGCDGYEEHHRQVSIWRRWIEWEKSDPLVIGKEDPEALKKRVLYVYNQAMMALRFEPQIWFDAAEYYFLLDMQDHGLEILRNGMAANPESCLLHFRYSEKLESTLAPGDTPETIHARSQKIRKPYEDLLEVLYGLAAKLQQREKEEVAKMEQMHASYGDADNDDGNAELERSVNLIKDAIKVQQVALSKTISSIWINLMRAMRRAEGHGKVGDLIGGSRQVFADARKRGKITSDVYVASALIEYHCYKDPAATRIFERGMKLFPEDEDFALEYLKHLIAINDITNARAVFETFVGKVSPERAKKVFRFFHEHESHYGELGQVYKLEKRMAELYPEDPYLQRFERRYAYNNTNPSTFLPVISLQQMRPKSFAPPQPIQQQRSVTPVAVSPRIPVRTIASPKRSAEESGASDLDQGGRPRKIHRPDSPIKGAAGRRLDQKRQQLQRERNERGRAYTSSAAPVIPSLPDGVMFLLGILPGADKYHATKFNPEAIVNLLRTVELPDAPPLYKR